MKLANVTGAVRECEGIRILRDSLCRSRLLFFTADICIHDRLPTIFTTNSNGFISCKSQLYANIHQITAFLLVQIQRVRVKFQPDFFIHFELTGTHYFNRELHSVPMSQKDGF
jgi:hypothetical protein